MKSREMPHRDNYVLMYKESVVDWHYDWQLYTYISYGLVLGTIFGA